MKWMYAPILALVPALLVAGSMYENTSENLTTKNAVAASSINYATPITISTGGSYSGSWRSDDPNKAAVTIGTSQPVTIENCNIAGKGDMIVSSVAHAKITVRGCSAIGSNPGSSGKYAGRFLRVNNFDKIDVQGNTMTSTSGIYLATYAGGGSAGNTITITANKVRNVDGRTSSGSGYQTGGFYRVQFVQFDKVRNVPGVLIAWNDVVNTPNVSRVEDNISMYLSSGTAASPIIIRDNLIRGGWPIPADTSSFSGGGILIGDGASSTAADASGYVTATGNTVIDTTNYGIAIAGGHHLILTGNRVISDGKLPDGKTAGAQNIGMYAWLQGGGYWSANSATGNTIGWRKGSGTNNWWLPSCQTGLCAGNINMTGTIDAAREDAEEKMWRDRAAAAGQVPGTPPPPTPVPPTPDPCG